MLMVKPLTNPPARVLLAARSVANSLFKWIPRTLVRDSHDVTSKSKRALSFFSPRMEPSLPWVADRSRIMACANLPKPYIHLLASGRDYTGVIIDCHRDPSLLAVQTASKVRLEGSRSVLAVIVIWNRIHKTKNRILEIPSRARLSPSLVVLGIGSSTSHQNDKNLGCC